MKKIWLISIVSIIFSSCNSRDANLTFNDFDRDDDSKIQLSEFIKVFTANYYNDWNTNDDDYLDDEDFYSSSYGTWDVDKNKIIDQEEWEHGYNYFYRDYFDNDYNDWDINEDNYLTYKEYKRGIEKTGIYKKWDLDQDNILSDEELARGVFKAWDINDNGVIDPDEFKEFKSYYLEDS